MTPAAPAAAIALTLSSAAIDRIGQAARTCVGKDLIADPDSYVRQAQLSVSCLPTDLVEALHSFRRYGSPTGGLLIRGLPTFALPATPSSPALATGAGLAASGVLGMVAAVIGDQYGFRPELDGHLVQDIVPVEHLRYAQQSTSSDEELYAHTELAFADDNDRADYIALFCLRADHDRVAGTILSPIETILPLLSDHVVDVLRQPRFRTTVDQSFLYGIGSDTPIWVGPIRVLSGSSQRPRVRADFAETTGTDAVADHALAQLAGAATRIAREYRLTPGDLLLVDNNHAFHGRTSFRPRFDGADRWLLRASITRDLARSEHRPGNGRVVEMDLGLRTSGELASQ